jgi:hypothetical protein
MLATLSSASSFRLAYSFLASNVLELYGKSFMCLRWEKEDKFDFEEINKRVSSFGHELNRIYHYQGVGDEFLQKAGISSALRKQKSGSDSNWHFFEFHIDSDIVNVYPVESLRYGAPSSKKNDSIITEPEKLLTLCNNVRSALLGQVKKFLKQ